MALLQVNFSSQSLSRIVPIQVILPTDKKEYENPWPADKPFKTLYLLHGFFGNYTSWVNFSRILIWAQEKNLAVVMPSGENKFYFDRDIPTEKHGTFIREEIVEFTRRSFPLSHERDDTFLGGLSMGGYGAIINGLLAPQTFGIVCAMSSALIIDSVLQTSESTNTTNNTFNDQMFGDPAKLPGSDKDYYALAENLIKTNTVLPRFHLSCGTEDSLIESNRTFKDKLINLGYDVTWEESLGKHDWTYWDANIKKILDWLPLDDGTNSGVLAGYNM